MRAMHAIEIPFKFNHPDEWASAVGQRPERFQVAANMSRAWATFARTGNPSHAGIGTWPAYTLEKRATLFLDAPSRVVDDPFRQERLVWQQIERPEPNPS
jgi:para-nitrobenzyl esterase